MIILKKCYSSDGTLTKQVIGGCVYRPFYNKKLSQVVFLAIDSQQQVKGYGTRLMNKLKSYAKTKGVQFFMTYADNMATDYFQKNGFSSTIRLPKSRYRNYIKDYENGTLMQCYLDTNIHFDQISKVLLHQRESLLNYLFQLSGFKQKPYQMKTNIQAAPSEDEQKKPVRIKFKQIQGVEQAGWEQQEYQRRLNNQKNRPFEDKASEIIEKLKKEDSMWPFIDPVKKEQAPDYYSVIANPMWLGKVEQRLKNKHYTDLDGFAKDMNQIFDNAMSYNKPDTIFYKYAREMKENLRFCLNQLKSDINRGDLYHFE